MTETTILAPADEIARIEAQAETLRTERSDGGHIVWRIWGEGPPAVLLHGGHGSWLHWLRNIEPLARRRRLILPDMPGYGDSPPPAARAIGTVAELLAAGIHDVTGGQQIDLVGFSLGAVIGGPVASRLGASVRHFSMLGSASLGLPTPPPAATVGWRAAATPEERRDAHRHNLGAMMLHRPAAIDDLAVELQSRNAERARLRFPGTPSADVLSSALRSVRGSLSAIWGEHDVLVGGAFAPREAVLRAIDPDCPVEIVPDAGHWVQYEAADTVNRILDRWLA